MWDSYGSVAYFEGENSMKTFFAVEDKKNAEARPQFSHQTIKIVGQFQIITAPCECQHSAPISLPAVGTTFFCDRHAIPN